MDSKNMKPGYQGTQDSMRDLAEQMMKRKYKKGGVVSDTDSDKKVVENPYKKGGDVASKCTAMKKQAYAMGGAAKVRLGMDTSEDTKKGSAKKVK